MYDFSVHSVRNLLSQALKTAGAHPVHKATIMPRGNALGMVMQLPDGDQTSMSRKQVNFANSWFISFNRQLAWCGPTGVLLPLLLAKQDEIFVDKLIPLPFVWINGHEIFTRVVSLSVSL